MISFNIRVILIIIKDQTQKQEYYLGHLIRFSIAITDFKIKYQHNSKKFPG